MKKRIFSGIQPSGIIHIGNYLGAITQFIKYQEEFDSIFCIVDLHAITVPQDPEKLKENTYKLAALYLACGIDPNKSSLFVQSHIPEHSELGWILNTITNMGELERMTQYKDKSGKYILSQEKTLVEHPVMKKMISDFFDKYNDKLSKKSLTNILVKSIRESSEEIITKTVPVGLFDYPVLMAADILLYNTDIVPVGEDQSQHVELSRSLARRFNNRFGETFKVPKLMLRESGARIMGLDDPNKKMSKSAESKYNYIALTDSEDEIRTKIMKAQTDGENKIAFDKDRTGIYNLLTIYKTFSDKSESEIEECFSGKGYGDFKKELAELVVGKLKPIQEKYNKLIKDKNYLDKILKEGRNKVRPIAKETLDRVKEKIGFVK